MRRYIEQWWNNAKITAIDQQDYLNQSFLAQCNYIDKIIASTLSKAELDNWTDRLCSEILKKLKHFLPEYVSPKLLKEWKYATSSTTSVSLLSLLNTSKSVSAKEMIKTYFQDDKIQDILVVALIERLLGSIGLPLQTLVKSISLENYEPNLWAILNLRNSLIHKSTEKLLNTKDDSALHTLYQKFVNGFPFVHYYPYNHEVKVSEFY